MSDPNCITDQLYLLDVLIHAGDLTNQGSLSEMRKATA